MVGRPLSTPHRPLTARGRPAITRAPRPAMAQLTQTEFSQAVAALAEHHGGGRLRAHPARMNAFTSRRGLTTAAAIAERLHLLTGGLRRQVPGTYSFSAVVVGMGGEG